MKSTLAVVTLSVAAVLPIAAQSTPAFEVVSIKPSPAGGRNGGSGGPGSRDPGRFTRQNATLFILLMEAYGVKSYQVIGPDWLKTEHFDIAAAIPPGTTKEQFLVMLQNMMADRFKMALHRDKKEMPVYDLMVAKGGPKFQESADDSASIAAPPPAAPAKPTVDAEGFPVLPPGTRTAGMVVDGHISTRWSKQNMEQFANVLAGYAGRPVIDQTGLKGKYDLTLRYVQEQLQAGPDDAAAPAAGNSGPNLYSALQSQLGLKLEPRKGVVDVLVIDRAERVPTGN